MSMKYPYRDLGVPFDRNFRNDLNANFDDIEHDIRMIGGEAAQQALEAAHEAETQAIYAQTSGDYAQDKGDYAAQQGDYAKTQGDYAKAQGNYAKAQGDYAKQVGDENKTRWLTAVNTYADIATTYPNPQLGDTVQTIDDSKIYRWNGTQWVWTQQYNANAITDVQNKIGILNEQLAEKAQKKDVGMSDLYSIWKSPAQPKSVDIVPGGASSPQMVTDYYSAYDALVANNPGYVVKTMLGYDQSNTYPIYQYAFTPQFYEKTIILTSLIHGSERDGFRGLLRFMQHVCNDYDKYPQLLYFRTRVRIIVVPIINPWGLANNSRYNSRGIDLNRNFNFRWSAKGPTYGASAASESETIILQNVIDTFADSATLLIDFHNTEPRLDSRQYYCSVPVWSQTERNVLNKIIKTIQPTASHTLIHPFNEPTLYNYAATKNINSLTVEWVPGAFHVNNSKDDVKDMVEFFTNCIIQLSRCNKPSFEKHASPKTYFINGSFLSKSVSVNQWTEMDFFRFQIPTDFEGIVEVFATFTYTNTDLNAENWFSTSFEQIGNDLYDNRFPTYRSVAAQQTETEMFTVGGARQSLTLLHAGKFFASNQDENVGDLIIKFYWKTTSGTLSLRRVRIVIKLTPTDSIKRFELWEESVSNSTLVELYPGSVF